MSLDYVARGESIKASTVNSIIDVVQGSGAQSPDLMTTGTKSGPQLVMPTQMKSSSLSKNTLFDQQNYILSAWPMSRLMLGFELGDCLSGVQMHAGSQVECPESAFVIFQNSANCPIGSQLSGYVLSSSHFGKDKATGASGWVDTLIEGLHGNSSPINLQVWSNGTTMCEVFTNVSSDDNVTSQLGEIAPDFTGASKISEWTLAKQTSLSVGSSTLALSAFVPTGKIQVTHGLRDIFSSQESGPTYFRCRYHQPDPEDRTTGRWEIYMPLGCVVVGSTCEPMNKPMDEVDGHEGDASEWKELCFVDNPIFWNQYAPAWTYQKVVPDGQGGMVEVNAQRYTWGVYVHAKTLAKIYGVDQLDAPAKRLAYASLRPLRINNAGTRTQAELDQLYWNATRAGDEASFEVGRIIVDRWVQEGELVEQHSYQHFRKTPFDIQGRPRTNFDLEWYFNVVDSTGMLSCDKVYCRRIEQAAAGMNVTGPTYVDVTNALSTIYARIDTNGDNQNVLNVDMDPQFNEPASDFVTWLHLYDISKNNVEADYRSSSLVNVQVFR